MPVPQHPADAPRSRGFLLRGVAVWLLIAAAEVVHGILRTLYLLPRVGDLPSRQIGVVTGSVIILVIAFGTVRWIAAPDRRGLVAVGLTWLLLMVGFEVTLGRVLGHTWERIVADYLPWEGGFMPAGLLVLALAPLVASRLRTANPARTAAGPP